jgi:uncharacterized protein
MSDYHRTVTSSPFGQATGRTTVAIDEGLRAYKLHVYNYMVFGLAITGLAALGIYMASVTGDPGAAAKILHNGVEVPARVAHDMYLTSIGYTMFVSPVKWIVILAPLDLVFGLSFGIERLRPATAQLLFWIFAALMGLSLGSIFMVYTHTSIVRVFFITAASFGALSLWGYTTQRDLSGMGSFLVMGLFGVILASLVNLFNGELGAAIRDLSGGCSGLRRTHRLGHTTPQEPVSVWRDGWRDRGALGDSGRTLALPELHQHFHAPAPAVWSSRRVIAGLGGVTIGPQDAPLPKSDKPPALPHSGRYVGSVTQRFCGAATSTRCVQSQPGEARNC